MINECADTETEYEQNSTTIRVYILPDSYAQSHMKVYIGKVKGVGEISPTY